MQQEVEVVVEELVWEREREMGKSEEEEILKRFGDEQSTLLDQYERLSFEVHLNKAIMLARSLSEPAAPRLRPGKQGRTKAAGFQKVMRKLFSPILGKTKPSTKDPHGDQLPNKNKNPLIFSKNFCRSLRV